MFKKLIRNKKAQNTAEYAILISIVVAGIIAMQTYAQRALQARVRDASIYLGDQTAEIGTSKQYEPYYLTTNYVVTRNENLTQILDNTTTLQREDSTRTREKDGFQRFSYDNAQVDQDL